MEFFGRALGLHSCSKSRSAFPRSMMNPPFSLFRLSLTQRTKVSVSGVNTINSESFLESCVLAIFIGCTKLRNEASTGSCKKIFANSISLLCTTLKQTKHKMTTSTTDNDSKDNNAHNDDSTIDELIHADNETMVRQKLTPQQISDMYHHTKILAPMVRVNQLPFRYMVANDFGADVVYSEELIDKKLVRTHRVIHPELQCVEYVDSSDLERVNRARKQLEIEKAKFQSHVSNNNNNNNSLEFQPNKKLAKLLQRPKPVFQTSPTLETKPLVLQIGTSTVDLAVQTAKHMYLDYDVIDVNCGCPKHFSVSGGMGAALLKDRERLCSILKGLVQSMDKPVTCKIRLLDNMSDTIDLVKSIEQTGVTALAVHARFIDQRSRDPAHLHYLEQIKSVVNIPLIANGDCFKYDDFETIRNLYKCDAVMTARGALWNPSIFQPDPLPRADCALKLISYVERFCGFDINTKYIISKMYEHPTSNNPVFKRVSQSKVHAEMIDILNQYGPQSEPSTKQTTDQGNSSVLTRKQEESADSNSNEPPTKKQKTEAQ